jgi:hypothetical protein
MMNPTARPASRQSCTCRGRSDQASTCAITTRPASSQQQQRQQQQRPQQQTQSRAPRAHSPSPTGTMRGQPATQPTTSHCQSFPASHIQSSQPPATTRKHLHLARAAGPHLEAPADAGREPQLEVPALSARGRTAYLGHMRSICIAIKDDMRCDQNNMRSTCCQHAVSMHAVRSGATCGQHAVNMRCEIRGCNMRCLPSMRRACALIGCEGCMRGHPWSTRCIRSAQKSAFFFFNPQKTKSKSAQKNAFLKTVIFKSALA